MLPSPRKIPPVASVYQLNIPVPVAVSVAVFPVQIVLFATTGGAGTAQLELQVKLILH